MNRDKRLVDEWVVSMRRIPEPLRVPDRVLDAIDRLCAKPSRKPSKVSAPGRAKPETISTASLRVDAIVRAGGMVCEFCGEPAHQELHHLDAGGGKARRQRIENVALLCVPCHRAWHRNDLDAFRDALYFCDRHGYRDTKRIVQRRIDKYMEARGAHPQRSSGTR